MSKTQHDEYIEGTGCVAAIRRQLVRWSKLSNAGSVLADGYLRVLNRLPRTPLPGRHRAFLLRPKGLSGSILLRPNTTDIHAFADVFYAAEYGGILDFCRPPPRKILDLGGNIGTSVRYWQHLFPDAQIVAVEPDAKNFSQLQKNILLGPAPANVKVICAFAATADGTAGIDRSQGEYGFRMTTEPGCESIATISMLKLIDLLAGQDGQVDFLKCDIEGAEADIFANSQAWIYRIATAVVETHPPYSPEGLLADVMRAGGIVEHELTLPKMEGRAVVYLRFRHP
ncbi:MAG: FkbM family methyltransferase [Phycisphaerales bacterium]|nr:FkbM family methyltransferase [Phycisphaerales bacterium]